MNPLGTRARAEELARLLDGARIGASAGSPSGGAAALSSYGDLAARLRAVGAGLTPVSAPRDEFRATLRTRLMAVAAVQSYNASTATAAPAVAAKQSKASAIESAVSWSHSRRVQRGMGVAAGAMASVVAVAGIAVAGNQSLPGDPFYGVKKGGEAFELRTSDGAVGKGSKHLEFAAERLSEVRGLTLGRDAALGAIGPFGAGPQAASAFGSSVSERVRRTLADMDTETRRGSDLLTASYRETGADAPLEILAAFAGTQSTELRALLPALPSAARERGEASLALVTEVAAQTSAMLAIGVCTGACAPAATAPSLPGPEGLPAPQPAPSATSNAPCGCSPSEPQPNPAGQPESTPMPTPSESANPEPTEAPSSPSPSPTPSESPDPLPVPLPVPLPTPLPTPPPLPIPVPTPSAPALVPGIPVPGVPLLSDTDLDAPLS